MNTSRNPDTSDSALNVAARDPFCLSALPELQPASDAWSAIATDLQQRSQQRRWISGFAVAATVALAFGLVSLLPQPSEGPLNGKSQTELADAAQNPVLEVPIENAGDALDADTLAENPDELQTLKKLSQRLERNLAYLRNSVGSMPAEMVVYQVELEDLVAQVDAAISQQPDASQLWQQRVNLLMDLNQIYGEGLRRDDPYVASL